MRKMHRALLPGGNDAHRESLPNNAALTRLHCGYEVWVAAVVAAGGAAYSANQQGKAARSARKGVDAAQQLEYEIYQQQREDQRPWMEQGRKAIQTLGDISDGDYSSFRDSPDYKFALEQGMRGQERGAASRGTQFSGGQLAASQEYAQGLATQNFNNYYNRISQLAGVGQTAVSNIGQAAQQYGQSAGGYAVERGNIAADRRLATASGYGQAANQIGNAFGRYYGRPRPRTAPSDASADQYYGY